MANMMPRPRVCAVCLQNPCACPELFEEDAGELEEDLAEALANSPFLVEMPEGVNRG